MTQNPAANGSEHYELDGSWLNGSFSQGTVARLTKASDGTMTLSNEWKSWPQVGSSMYHTDGKDFGGNFLVDYPGHYRNQDGTMPSLSDEDKASGYRYSHEDVELRLIQGLTSVEGNIARRVQ